MAEVHCPTLLLTGDGDFEWSASSLETAAGLFSRGRAETIPATGHLPFFEDTPAFEASVQRFVSDCEERDS
jgi:pimeloyl-ACP methyl ester carboxylesterase